MKDLEILQNAPEVATGQWAYLFSYRTTTEAGHIHIYLDDCYKPKDTFRVMRCIKDRKKLSDTPVITNVYFFGRFDSKEQDNDLVTRQ